MTTKEFHLLNLIIYDGETKIYEGISEEVPKEISDKQIVIDKIVDKTLIVKLVDN